MILSEKDFFGDSPDKSEPAVLPAASPPAPTNVPPVQRKLTKEEFYNDAADVDQAQNSVAESRIKTQNETPGALGYAWQGFKETPKIIPDLLKSAGAWPTSPEAPANQLAQAYKRATGLDHPLPPAPDLSSRMAESFGSGAGLGVVAELGAPIKLGGEALKALGLGEFAGAAKTGLKALASPFYRGALGGGFAGAGAEAGGALGSQVDKALDNKTPYGNIVGQIAGGLGGALEPAAWRVLVSKPLEEMYKTNPGKWKDAAGKLLAQHYVKGTEKNIAQSLSAGGAPVKENLAKSNELLNKIPELKTAGVSLAQRAGDEAPGIQAVLRDLEAKNPELSSRSIDLYQTQQKIISDFAEKHFPATGKKVETLTGEEVSNQHAALNEVKQAIELHIADLRRDINDHGFTSEKGELLRNALKIQKNSIKEHFGVAYTALGEAADSIGFRANLVPVNQHLKALQASDPQTFAKVSPLFKELEAKTQPYSELTKFSTIAGKKGSNIEIEYAPQANFNEAHSLWKRLNKEIRETPETELATLRSLRQLKDEVHNTLMQGDPRVANQLRSIDKGYREQVVEPFYEGATGKSLSSGRFGDRVESSRIFDQYWNRGGTGAKEWLSAKQPANASALFDGVMEKLRETLGKNNTVDAAAVNKFMLDNKDFLSHFPEVKTKLGMISLNARSLGNELEKVATRKAELGASMLSEITGKNVPEYLVGVTQNANAAKSLADMVKTHPEIGEAVHRAYADMLLDGRSTERLLRNANNLKPVFDAIGHNAWENFETIAQTRAMILRGGSPVAGAKSAILDPVREATGTSLPSLVQMGNAVAQGRAGKLWAATMIGARYVFTSQFKNAEEMLYSTLHDPEASERLIQAADSIDLKALAAKGREGLGRESKEKLKDFAMVMAKNGIIGNIAALHTNLQRDEQLQNNPPPTINSALKALKAR